MADNGQKALIQKMDDPLTRREFIKKASELFPVVTLSNLKPNRLGRRLVMRKAIISLVKTDDRRFGVKRSIELLNSNKVRGKDVLIKPNFNTADPAPASTHNDTLSQLILELRNMGALNITIGERSGPPETREVLAQKGIFDLARDHGVGLINFDEMPSEDWIFIKPRRSHWRNGFHVARPILEADCIISTCCLKTHQYGGIFTLSLKLSVGIVPRRGYPYMRELHLSPYQRKMIAEINQVYRPSLIVVDGVEAFVDGGPDRGVLRKADVFLAGKDRIAIDAVGVAILKELGSNRDIMGRRIFEQEQIARAVELGLGVKGPEEIEIVTGDPESERYAERIRKILKEG